MGILYSLLLLLAGCVFQPVAAAQELDESIAIQRAPGVENLPADERFVATLRTWGDLPGPVHFEVLPWGAPPTAQAIFQGVTDANGLARVELPRSAANGWNERSGINARLVEPGSQRLQGGRRIHKGMGRLHFNLPLKRGSTQFVFLVDGAGQGISAYLQWRRAGDPRSVLEPSITMEDALPKGWKALHFSQTMDVDLTAVREIGANGMAGSLLGVSLELGQDSHPIVLRLQAGHQFQGVVRYANGVPAKNVWFRAHWAGPSDPDELLAVCASPLDEWRLQSQGLLVRHVQTGEQGEFLADGLRPGLYKFEFGNAWVIPQSGKALVAGSPPGTQAETYSLRFPTPRKPLTRESLSPFDPREGPELVEGAPRGTLDIRAVGRGAGIQRDVDLFVTPLKGGSKVASARFGGDQLRVELPPGRYRVFVIGSSPRGGCGFDRHESRRFGRSEKLVEVFEGRVTEEKVEIRVGGFLEINLEGGAVGNDRLATLRDLSTPPGVWYGPGLRSSRPEIKLVSQDGRQESVSWFPESGPYNRGTELQWPFGETHKSECLPTGTFELIARMPGGRTAQARVTIESGKTSQVALDFDH